MRWLAFTDADTSAPNWLVKQLGCRTDAVCGVISVADWTGYIAAVREECIATNRDREGPRHVHGANLGLSAQAYEAVGGFAHLETPVTTGGPPGEKRPCVPRWRWSYGFLYQLAAASCRGWQTTLGTLIYAKKYGETLEDAGELALSLSQNNEPICSATRYAGCTIAKHP